MSVPYILMSNKQFPKTFWWCFDQCYNKNSNKRNRARDHEVFKLSTYKTGGMSHVMEIVCVYYFMVMCTATWFHVSDYGNFSSFWIMRDVIYLIHSLITDTGGGTDLERGMCGPEDPLFMLFMPLLQFIRVPFQAKAKESVYKTPFRENLEILDSTVVFVENSILGNWPKYERRRR